MTHAEQSPCENRQSEFEREIASVLNRYSAEQASDTPDFILADYLMDCLEAWNFALNAREKWYGRRYKSTPSLLPNADAAVQSLESPQVSNPGSQGGKNAAD